MKRALEIMLLAIAAPIALAAAPVSAERAVEAASRWVRRDRGGMPGGKARHVRGRRQMAPKGRPTGRIRTCSAGGTNLFHLVALDGGGFIAVAADDTRQQIMGFSPSGELPDSDMNNPFWSLSGADTMAARGMRRHRDRRKGGRVSLRLADSAMSQKGRTDPKTSLAQADDGPVKNETGLDDVRVSPLVESKWDQSYVRSKAVYNYYTPEHWVCGCVATAMAQLMRYHRHPSSSVAAQTFLCRTNGVAVELEMKGGIYDWDGMPLVPTASILSAQREMIGRLCYDAGVAVRMQYSSGGSAAYTVFSFDPLKGVFGYSSACSYIPDGTDGSLYASAITNGILANLDAGCPVLLGIDHLEKENYGHAIVADGYGYVDGVLYCHLNMGWSGSSDYWYALPEIKTDSLLTTGDYYEANTIQSLIYNIFPDKTGELITGRVTDGKGNPVEGASVSADITYGRWPKLHTTATTTTSGNGIYAIFAPAGKSSTATISVSFHGASTNITASASASASITSVNFDTGGYSIPGGGLKIGNSWGNDVTLDLPKPFRLILR